MPNGSIRTVRCGLPDGRLDRAEEALRKILTSELRHSDLVLAPLLNDGHADHDAAGAAAREVCNVVGATCRYFPIWAWQWHTPGSSEISTNGIRIDLSTTAQAAKAAALACFPSQTSGNPPVLPEHFLQLFDESYEVIVSDEPTRVAAP